MLRVILQIIDKKNDFVEADLSIVPSHVATINMLLFRFTVGEK